MGICMGALITFASHNLCNSFLMIMGNTDDYYTMEEAYKLYNLVPIPEKEFVEYDTGIGRQLNT